jgi:hypothetical protein
MGKGTALLAAGYLAAGFGAGIAVGDFAARWNGFDRPQTVPCVGAFIAWAGLAVTMAGWSRRRRATSGFPDRRASPTAP